MVRKLQYSLDLLGIIASFTEVLRIWLQTVWPIDCRTLIGWYVPPNCILEIPERFERAFTHWKTWSPMSIEWYRLLQMKSRIDRQGRKPPRGVERHFGLDRLFSSVRSRGRHRVSIAVVALSSFSERWMGGISAVEKRQIWCSMNDHHEMASKHPESKHKRL